MAMPRMSEADEKAMYGDKAFSYSFNIGVPTSGDPLFLYIRAYEPTSWKPRIFRMYKRDAKDLDPGTLDTWLVEVDSLGDEALFFLIWVSLCLLTTALVLSQTPSTSPVTTAVLITWNVQLHASTYVCTILQQRTSNGCHVVSPVLIICFILALLFSFPCLIFVTLAFPWCRSLGPCFARGLCCFRNSQTLLSYPLFLLMYIIFDIANYLKTCVPNFETISPHQIIIHSGYALNTISI